MTRTLVAALLFTFATAALAAEPKKGESLAERNKAVVQRYENEFKNKENVNIADELMAPDFVHIFPDPSAPAGREGLKALRAGWASRRVRRSSRPSNGRC